MSGGEETTAPDTAYTARPRLGLLGWLAVVLVLALATGAYVGVRTRELPFLKGPHGYTLTDPDSFLRWRLVQRALAGEGVRIRWIDEDNAPFGRLNEWTSPMTILGVAGVRAVELVTGAARPRALELAPLVLTPILGFVAMAMLGVLGWRAGGWPLGLAWVVAWPVLEDVFIVTRPGYVDHNVLHQLLIILVYGVCVHPGRHPGRTGVVAGLAAAGLVWATASEAVVLLAPVGVLTVAVLGFAGQRPAWAPAFCRGFWYAALAGSSAALLFEFWPRPWHTHLELLGPWHVWLLLLAAGLTEVLCRTSVARWRSVVLVAAAGVLAALAALALRGFQLDQLHTVQDARFQAMARVIYEFRPLPTGATTVPRLWMTFGLLPLALPAAFVLLFRRAEVHGRLVLAATLLLAALACWQARWVCFGAPLLVMTAGLVVQRWLPRRGWLVVALPALATIGPWLHSVEMSRRVAGAQVDPIQGPYSIWFALEEAARCMGTPADRPVVLAPWDAGGVLAGTGRVRVIGSQYWSNVAGCADTFELFTTADGQRFAELLHERDVRYILLPDVQSLPRFINECFVALHGRPASPEVLQASALRRAVLRGHMRRVPCPAFERWRPGWMILQAW